MNKYAQLLIVSLVLSMLNAPAGLAADQVDLDRIVVSTSARAEEEVGSVPVPVTVITQTDIKDSNAQTIPDLLRGEPGIVIRDIYGNGAKAVADVRGFGEEAALDVLVLVDGRRTNAIDQSGTDWSQIPLDRVDTIEIVRGTRAGVLYGDNAVSGVINIKTKRGSGKPAWKAEAEAGSYGMNKQALSVGGSEKKASYFFSQSRQHTDGYRKNSGFDADDTGGNLRCQLTDDLGIDLDSGYHQAELRFPGALSSANLTALGPRATIYPKDHTNDKDYYIQGKATQHLGDAGTFELGSGFRRREDYNSFLSSEAGFNPISKTGIDTVSLTPKYILETTLAGRQNRLVTGFDFYRYDYFSHVYDDNSNLQNYIAINKISTAYYALEELELAKNLTVSGGYRRERSRYDFNFHDMTGWVADVNADRVPEETSYTAGASYKYRENSNVYASYGRSFRFPAVDEYFDQWATPPLNMELQPQESWTWEGGINHQFTHRLSGTASAYRMEIKNELFYDPASFANGNYDHTQHDGVDLSLKAKLTQKASLTGTYSYTHAQFRGGEYANKDVPMVPRNKGSLGLAYALTRALNLDLAARYTGKRYFINDQNNNFSRLNEYVTLDTQLSYRWKELTASVGVNNILDRRYSELGVCNATSGAKNYYPSPGRNYFVKMDYTF